jgi:hypothetical protein
MSPHFNRSEHCARNRDAGILSLLFFVLLFLGPSLARAAGSASDEPAVSPLQEGSWRFIVSGDSRNCGDVVMPAIAAHSAKLAPAFYWHLGDLRAIYKIDEDMFYEAQNKGETLSCDNYQRHAWDDFVENQIAPFGDLPFYVGIGNHEVIPPKNEAAFKRQFFDWLDAPALQRQRQLDHDAPLPASYFHWIQGGVDFIYLDNAMNFFPEDELTWLVRRLQSAKYNSQVKSVVVGMHEALPDSIANDHSMGDNPDEPRARSSGETFYRILWTFHDKTQKPVYVLSSHSHFFMENIFDTPALTPNETIPLPGWVIGTAGAVRYELPKSAPPSALTDVYGYLVGTVAANGTIRFSFQRVQDSDIPQYVRQRYPAMLIPWCFDHNSLNKEPKAKDITPRCP